MLHVVIMAGGTGTRFWPESRADRPKQLLKLIGERSLIAQTLSRVGALVPREHVLVVTSAVLAERVSTELPELPERAIVGEPVKRDTAPCIGLAAGLIARRDPQATMVVMPSDHLITPDDAFRRALEQAASLVEQDTTRLVTFGIRPTYASTSFGYIERGAVLESPAGGAATYRVARFREKPGLETAWEYLNSGRFYWNSGIFVWKAATILQALAERQPQMMTHLERIQSAWGTAAQNETLAREFAEIQPISVDYAVMEHARNVAVIEAPFEWDDVGSWQALMRRHGADAQGNTVFGRHVGWHSEGNIVRGVDDHLIVTVGMRDTVVVHTPDVTLVANKRDEEAMREVIRILEQKGWKEYL